MADNAKNRLTVASAGTLVVVGVKAAVDMSTAGLSILQVASQGK